MYIFCVRGKKHESGRSSRRRKGPRGEGVTDADLICLTRFFGDYNLLFEPGAVIALVLPGGLSSVVSIASISTPLQ